MKKNNNHNSVSLRISSRRFTFVLICCALAALCPKPAQAAADGKEAGARLLRAELPTGTTIQQADCELLSRAVGRATLAHRTEAPAILSAALTDGRVDDEPRKEAKRPCECVAHVVRACVKVAPEQASAVLDVALALYPDCADTLSAILDEARKDLQAYNFDRQDYKNVADAPVAGINNVGTGAASTNGFGAGFGPGFPGSPGFSGSSPSGGAALTPPPNGTAATSTANQ